MSLIVKIAQLAKELGVNVDYHYVLNMDPPASEYCRRSESYIVYADGYKTLYFPIFEQVLELTSKDFVKDNQ